MDKTAEILIDVSGFISEYSAHMMGCGVHTSRVIRSANRIGESFGYMVKISVIQKKEKTRSKSKYINWLLITIVAVLLGSMVVELVQNV